MTDREKLRDEIERMCVITGRTFEEKDKTISVRGGPKYTFTEAGEIKSIIRGGISYGPLRQVVLR